MRKNWEPAMWIDLVNRIWGPCTDEEADALLMNATAFPFAGPIYTARQLRELKKVSGGDIGKAIDFANDATLAEMAKIG